MNLLAIDPGINRVGVAVASLETGELIFSGCIYGPENTERIEERIAGCTGQLSELCAQFTISKVLIEPPQPFGSYKSLASQQSTSLIKLYFSTGALFWCCRQQYPATYLIPVSEYKGQLPKEVTRKRVENYYCKTFGPHDEADAVYLAYWGTVLRKRS